MKRSFFFVLFFKRLPGKKWRGLVIVNLIHVSKHVSPPSKTYLSLPFKDRSNPFQHTTGNRNDQQKLDNITRKMGRCSLTDVLL